MKCEIKFKTHFEAPKSALNKSRKININTAVFPLHSKPIISSGGLTLNMVQFNILDDENIKLVCEYLFILAKYVILLKKDFILLLFNFSVKC